jgi:hypothetical protein
MAKARKGDAMAKFTEAETALLAKFKEARELGKNEEFVSSNPEIIPLLFRLAKHALKTSTSDGYFLN